MIFEQVYFIDVEKTAIRACKQSGIESFATGRQRALDIDGPTHPILSRAEWKFNNGDRHFFRSDLRTVTLIAQIAVWITVIRTTGNDIDLRQQVCEGAHGSRLPCAAMSHDQDAADQRVNDVQQQGELHLLLPDNRRKRIIFSVYSIHRLHRLPDFKSLCNLWIQFS